MGLYNIMKYISTALLPAAMATKIPIMKAENSLDDHLFNLQDFIHKNTLHDHYYSKEDRLHMVLET